MGLGGEALAVGGRYRQRWKKKMCQRGHAFDVIGRNFETSESNGNNSWTGFLDTVIALALGVL
jgi:hypothetical protein